MSKRKISWGGVLFASSTSSLILGIVLWTVTPSVAGGFAIAALYAGFALWACRPTHKGGPWLWHKRGQND